MVGDEEGDGFGGSGKACWADASGLGGRGGSGLAEEGVASGEGVSEGGGGGRRF